MGGRGRLQAGSLHPGCKRAGLLHAGSNRGAAPRAVQGRRSVQGHGRRASRPYGSAEARGDRRPPGGARARRPGSLLPLSRDEGRERRAPRAARRVRPLPGRLQADRERGRHVRRGEPVRQVGSGAHAGDAGERAADAVHGHEVHEPQAVVGLPGRRARGEKARARQSAARHHREALRRPERLLAGQPGQRP